MVFLRFLPRDDFGVLTAAAATRSRRGGAVNAFECRLVPPEPPGISSPFLALSSSRPRLISGAGALMTEAALGRNG
jgi:hypothetical protein